MAKNTSAYRDEYRSENISAGYSAIRHMLFNAAIGLSFIAWATSQLDTVTVLEWFAIPLTFLYANFAEYLGHRYPMHNPLPGLSTIYRRHAKEHHRFFVADYMAFDEPRDVKAVLFPPTLVLFFASVFGVPMWFLVSWLWSSNAAWLFVLTGAGYFLNYEVLHTIYHLPEQSRIRQLPIIDRLSIWHTVHHQPELMRHYNFNITYPICDLLFGTLKRSSEKLKSTTELAPADQP